MRYLVLAYGDEQAWKALTDDERRELLARDEVLRRRGDTVAAVARCVTVRSWRTPSVTPGPFCHPDVPLAGFGVIEARDLDEAVSLVARTPCAVAKGAVEVWPIRDGPR